MAFYGYKGDDDECYSTPQGSTYAYDFGPAPVQASSHYSSPYEFGEPELIEYKSSSYCRDYSFVTPLELNHSVCTYSQPKILQYEPIDYRLYNYSDYSVNPSDINYRQPKFLRYEPPPHDHGYFPSETKFTISYSTVEFNEPDFEEYDPTPYSGGYDPVTTYGKPLPPSDATCYPRTVPQSDGDSLENFSYASIPSPYGRDDDLPTKPSDESKPIDTKTESETRVENGGKVTSDGEEDEIVEPDVTPSDDSPSYEHQSEFENGVRGDYGYGSERMVPQIPYGAGLEAMDLCESLFGYWPCLTKEAQQQRNKYCQFCDQERRMDPWKSAADYLFGSPMVYDYENCHHQHQQYYYWDQNSWLQ